MPGALNLIWIIVILMSIVPVLKQRNIERLRYKLMSSIEESRNSRVIALIHREEAISFFGIPIRRYIDIEDSEQILRAIRMTPSDMPIDIILHTPGGLVLATEQIANALMSHDGYVTVFVPHYAMSGGTMLALAANEIVMDDNAVLGPVDPQIAGYPAASILKVMKEKNRDRIGDKTIILADMALKAMAQVKTLVFDILKDKMDEDKAKLISATLVEGNWTHDYPISPSVLTNMGLNIKTELPADIYKLMELYPQTRFRKTSVQYIPIPYDNKDADKGE